MKFAFLPWLLTKHFSPNEGEGGGGGSGGSVDDDGGSGDGGPNTSAGSAASKGLTDEQKKSVETIVNTAVQMRFREFSQKQSKALDDASRKITETVTTTFSSQLGELKETILAGREKQEPSEDDITRHPEVKKLMAEAKRAAKLDERLSAMETEKETERKKAKDADLRTQVSEALTKAGVDPRRIPRLATAFIGGGEVGWNEDGSAIEYRGGEAPEDLEAGLKAWTDTEEGKTYLPPRGSGGSGDGARKQGGTGAGGAGGKKPNGSSTLPSDAELGQQLQNMLRG